MSSKRIDYTPTQIAGVQISEDSRRLWVCVDGECVLRIHRSPMLQVTDLRALADREPK